MSNETADASRLAWAATSHGVNSAPIQSALLGYLQASRTYEWHGTNAAEGDDPATAHAVANLENAVRTQAARPTLGTPASTELLASLDALTNDRRARLAAASHQLPVLYVAVLVLTGAALIVNAATLTLRSERGLAGILSYEFDPAPDVLASVLTCCDMTTSPDGQPVQVQRRLAEIRDRYGPGHLVSRSIQRATPMILRAVEQVQDRTARTA